MSQMLYLIRHGQPNVETYRGFPGPPLGELGRAQAKAIASFLDKQAVEELFASDYLRVQQTMEPFRSFCPELNCTIVEALREREKETESHDSLVQRVQNWYVNERKEFANSTAIFSHCGPINMILEYLDPSQNILDYPYVSKHLCRTPKGGIWILEMQASLLKKGRLWLPEH